MTKPLLLIDVDGVLNNYYGGKPSKGWEKSKAMGYTLWTHPKHGEWLLSLQDDFELAWATTWTTNANVYISPLVGLPQLPTITDFPGLGEQVRGVTGKLLGVQLYVGDRPFAWLDDDLGKDAHVWANVRTLRGTPTLMLDVDPRMCLLEHHIEKLRKWAEDARRAPASV